jgi:tRNA nucleotidyltransferase (CCA-adding enzyme)
MARKLARDVRIFQVGGAVRDELLGRPVADRDWVVVGATPEMMVASGFRPVGNDFPVFLHPETHEEHALARTERKHGAGYRGFEFFASPDVTLEEDLARRDLTVNAMARDESGTLIDPYDGRGDLARGVLRHVSPAFAEDPLRVLRVARFAARLGFSVAPPTVALMRDIVASGELATLPAERVWREIARALMEEAPSRMLDVLRECGALAALLPEVDALFGASLQAPVDAGAHVAQALDYCAHKGWELAVRYAVLAQDLGFAASARTGSPRRNGHVRASVRAADGMSARLKVPIDCRDAAHLSARFRRSVHEVAGLRASALLDLVVACDALRRPQRLGWLARASQADACSLPGAPDDYPQARRLDEALRIIKAVDSGAIARDTMARPKKTATRAATATTGTAAGTTAGTTAGADRAADISGAVRRARLAALAKWMRAQRVK